MNRKMPAVLALPNGQIFSKLIFGLPKNKPTNSFFYWQKNRVCSFVFLEETEDTKSLSKLSDF